METFEQSFSIDKLDAGTLESNEIIYADNLVLTPITNNVLQLIGRIYAGSAQTPINGATIVVYTPDDEAVAVDQSRIINSQDGSYLIVFNGVYGQIYGVTAELEGYDSVNQNIAFSNSQVSVLNFTLPVSTTQNTIYGKVTDTQGKPIANANVVVWSTTSQVSVKTSDEGAYVATADFTAGGQWVITVSKFGYVGKTMPITFPTTNSLEENFSLQANTLQNYTSIAGQVVTQQGTQTNPIANAFVGLFQVDTTVTPENQILINSMLTDTYGYYAFADIPAGYEYIIRATKIVQQTES